MARKILHIVCGVPGSGKSTWLREHVTENRNATPSIVVSRDEIRFEFLNEDDEYFSQETKVYREFIRQIKQAIDLWACTDIYVDATHLTRNSREKLLKSLGQEYLNKVDEVSALVIKTDLETCIARNENRKGTRAYVPVKVIEDMYGRMTNPSLEEGFDTIYLKTENDYLALIQRK
jgi:predicted kinase